MRNIYKYLIEYVSFILLITFIILLLSYAGVFDKTIINNKMKQLGNLIQLNDIIEYDKYFNDNINIKYEDNELTYKDLRPYINNYIKNTPIRKTLRKIKISILSYSTNTENIYAKYLIEFSNYDDLDIAYIYCEGVYDVKLLGWCNIKELKFSRVENQILDPVYFLLNGRGIK